MEIIWHGLSFFEIKGKRDGEKVTLAINPFDKSSGLKPPEVKADILVFSSPLKRGSALETATGTSFLIDGPGEYEIKGVKIRGIPTVDAKREEKGKAKNTIFKIEFEEIKICHLGNFNEDQVSSGILESIFGIDILFVPIGRDLTVSGKEAAKLVSQIEPKTVIPMNYLPSESRSSFKTKGLKLDLQDEKDFLRNYGVKEKEKIKKLKIRASNLQRNGTELILLEMA